ncbi:hypothetical protein GGX14DRAFT_495526 [Mycena pura]|uniref:rRNA adenine N(6)-methyltransferase n=1 Tax=Mycena pura TaxID=153505 RepID=A0AAD6YF77_9AGAR|nr:hypothetical protein GGX14DRAFT_495526 [Mycena pura]
MLCTNQTRRRAVAFCCRLYSTPPKPISFDDTASLPPRALWRQYFPSNSKPFQHRVSISNSLTAAKLADAFVPEGSRDKIIVEIFPGPGQLTRALLALPRSRIKQLIVLENAEAYLKYLKPLERVDSRIRVLPLGGELWVSYQTLQDMKILDEVNTVPWEQGNHSVENRNIVHPQLHFISHLSSSVSGEQLISQLLRSIPDQQWLFKYGRVPMSFLLSEYIWKRVLGDSLAVRCKLSTMAAAIASCTTAVPSSVLLPYAEHFHPIPPATALAQREKERRGARPLMMGKPGNPFVAVNITPLEHQVWFCNSASPIIEHPLSQVIQPGMLDKWDYCLRHLYVNRATPVKNALPYLAPNAQSLLKGLTSSDVDESERINPKTPVREMTIKEWSLLVKAFDEWPFAPEDLSITDTIGIDDEKHG